MTERYGVLVVPPEQLPVWMPGVTHRFFSRSKLLREIGEECWTSWFHNGFLYLVVDKDENAKGMVIFEGIRPECGHPHMMFWGLTRAQRLIACRRIAEDAMWRFQWMRLETRIPSFAKTIRKFTADIGFTEVGDIPAGMTYRNKPISTTLYVLPREGL